MASLLGVLHAFIFFAPTLCYTFNLFCKILIPKTHIKTALKNHQSPALLQIFDSRNGLFDERLHLHKNG